MNPIENKDNGRRVHLEENQPKNPLLSKLDVNNFYYSVLIFRQIYAKVVNNMV